MTNQCFCAVSRVSFSRVETVPAIETRLAFSLEGSVSSVDCPYMGRERKVIRVSVNVKDKNDFILWVLDNFIGFV